MSYRIYDNESEKKKKKEMALVEQAEKCQTQSL